VRLTPKSSRDEIGGLDRLADGRMILKVRVRALPQDGEANEALLRLIAKALHIPQASVRIEAGASGRVKTLSLAGDTNVLQADLAQLSSGGVSGDARSRKKVSR
jgi:uncharacterized protein YggU (UPF0235/DUF167 family)